jgi:hypothetical protein
VRWRARLPLCVLLFAGGVVLLLVVETGGPVALRIVAVAALLAGAIGGGVRAGLAAEPPALFATLAARLTHGVARALVAVLLLPAALTLVLAVAGAVLRPQGASPTTALAAGAAVALVLLAVLAAALAVALRALRGTGDAA